VEGPVGFGGRGIYATSRGARVPGPCW